jgi:hypothetical protein
MVNGWFPSSASYGFEMVDTAARPYFSRNNAINRKFTPNQMKPISGEFSAI